MYALREQGVEFAAVRGQVFDRGDEGTEDVLYTVSAMPESSGTAYEWHYAPVGQWIAEYEATANAAPVGQPLAGALNLPVVVPCS